MTALKGKKILLGVCGSIAAYKAILLLRALQKQESEVKVIMTAAATKFITPLSFEAITHSPVYSDLISNHSWNNHVEISLWADLYIIAPASANTIAKLAHGLADDIVSATYLASRCPVYIAPSMDVDMWHHKATQANIEIVKSRGARVIPVGDGYLASGLSGKGRMAEPDDIVNFLEESNTITSPLKSKRVLITAGPTYENIDPVRFVGNASTGKMGISIAETMANLGCDVTLILGPTHLSPTNPDIKCIGVRSAEQMLASTKENHPKSDIIIFSAAVADYRPAHLAKDKIKKLDDVLELKLIKNPDIAYELGKSKRSDQLHIGFALESTTGEEYAKEKMEKKNFDMVVLNSLTDPGAGFGYDTNKTTFYFKDNKSIKFELKSKELVAKDIAHAIERLIITR